METTTSEITKMDLDTEKESTTGIVEECTRDSSRMVRVTDMELRLTLTEPRRQASGRMANSSAR